MPKISDKLGRRKKPFFEKAEILDYGAEGKAIAKIDEKVVFVKLAAPGDIVDLQVTKKRKNYMEARVTGWHHYSEIRQNPFCDHFGVCGGCNWQHIPYEKQLEFKHKQVVETLKRIGKVELPEIQAILGSDQNIFYRNKMEYTFSAHRWLSEEELQSDVTFDDTRALGFHVPGLYDKIVDINKCWLQPEPGNKIRNFIREYCLKNNVPYYSQKKQDGIMRNLIVRTASTGENMVVLSFFQEHESMRKDLLAQINKHFPEIDSLMYVINSKANDTLYDQHIKLFSGKDHIVEEMEGLKFKIGPKSFFQTNTAQGLKLYQIVRDFAAIDNEDVVYDLYTGTGTIANFVAGAAKKVVGIESVPEAIEDAKINSKLNNISNTVFFTGDMKDLFSDSFIEENGSPDILITDPPRAGMHANVTEQILKIEPGRIVYVSCNPATQARDLQLLDEKYKVTAVQPVDMFPHTHHVENVVRLDKK